MRYETFAIALSAALLACLFGCEQKKEKAAPAPAAVSSQPLKGEKALLIIASKNFRDEEYLETRAALEKAGAQVEVASSSLEEATGMLGAKAKADMLLKDADVAKYNTVVFIGGGGATEYFQNATALKIAQDAAAQGKVLGAICIAPVILANAGILKGRKATCFASGQKALTQHGAVFTNEDVTVDGKIVTGRGPKAAKKFGRALVELLTKGK